MEKNKKNLSSPPYNKDFETFSLNDILTRSYGPKGTYNRELAEIKIKAISKNISYLNKLKEEQGV